MGGGSLKAMEVLAELERALDVTLGPARAHAFVPRGPAPPPPLAHNQRHR
ncbi:acyl carrier protein [Streptomyces fungicidicus]